MNLKKPPHGEPCNGCGLCCMSEVCPLGQILFDRVRGPCPALEWKGGKSACGLVTNPARYVLMVGEAELLLRSGAETLSKGASDLIGSGTGCDAQLEDEEPNLAFRAKLARLAEETQDEAERAFIAWGIQ